MLCGCTTARPAVALHTQATVSSSSINSSSSTCFNNSYSNTAAVQSNLIAPLLAQQLLPPAVKILLSQEGKVPWVLL
jgi:hypothetical protein